MDRIRFWLAGVALGCALQAQAGAGDGPAAPHAAGPGAASPPAAGASLPGDDAIRAKGAIAGTLLRCEAASAAEVGAWVRHWRDAEADPGRFDALYREGLDAFDAEYDGTDDRVRQGACHDARQFAARMRGPDGPDVPFGTDAARHAGLTRQMLLVCGEMGAEALDAWKQAMRSLATDPARFDALYAEGVAEFASRHAGAGDATGKAICEEAAALARKLRARADWLFE